MATYDVLEEKIFPQAEEQVLQAIKGAIAGLEGEIIEVGKDEAKLKVYFPKTILGNTLGDRTHALIEWAVSGRRHESECLGVSCGCCATQIAVWCKKRGDTESGHLVLGACGAPLEVSLGDS